MIIHRTSNSYHCRGSTFFVGSSAVEKNGQPGDKMRTLRKKKKGNQGMHTHTTMHTHTHTHTHTQSSGACVRCSLCFRVHSIAVNSTPLSTYTVATQKKTSQQKKKKKQQQRHVSTQLYDCVHTHTLKKRWSAERGESEVSVVFQSTRQHRPPVSSSSFRGPNRPGVLIFRVVSVH
jgi:hypothetical protein